MIIIYRKLKQIEELELKQRIMLTVIITAISVGLFTYIKKSDDKNIKRKEMVLKSLKSKKDKKIYEINTELDEITLDLNKTKELINKLKNVKNTLVIGQKNIKSHINQSKKKWYNIASFINKRSVFYKITINNLENIKLLNERKSLIKEEENNTKDILKVTGLGSYFNIVKFIHEIEKHNKYIYIDYMKLKYDQNRAKIKFTIIVKLNK